MASGALNERDTAMKSEAPNQSFFQNIPLEKRGNSVTIIIKGNTLSAHECLICKNITNH